MRTKPYLADPDVMLYQGDCLDVLCELPDRSVHMACTSPPFYGLRNYGVDGQIGLEETIDEWVERLVEVFREVRRVLRDDGTCWIEIGDSYCANDAGKGRPNEGHVPNAWQHRDVDIATKGAAALTPMKHPTKPKDLLGQPWALAFALRNDGWYLRSEIIWHKLNPMPESVTDRPTKAHSTVFLFSKKPKYYFDQEAVREPWTSGRDDMRTKGVRTGAAYLQQDSVTLNHPTLGDLPPEALRGPDGRRVTHVKGRENSEQHRDGERWPNSGANIRSVWAIPTEPTPFAHFATWPSALCRKMILAGTSEYGVCSECGAPWIREVEDHTPRTWTDPREGSGKEKSLQGRNRMNYGSTTTGWNASCECAAEVVPATVLDIFGGSGTTALVARKLGRKAILIELSSEYCALAADRLAQQSLFTEGVT